MVAASTCRIRLTPDILLPDLLTEHPEARAVFDRHGLNGCGGPLGPRESIQFFARIHGIDETSLLAELEQSIGEGTHGASAPSLAASGVAEQIYRPFFLGAIVLTLTAGATWGAWMLWLIALSGTFRAASLASVNAHGEAQVFGWLGLFVMGFAYQALPRLWHTRLVQPGLALRVFALMVVGVLLRTIGVASGDGGWLIALPLAMAGGGLEALAVAVFVVQIYATFRTAGARIEPYVGFVLGGLAWFLASSLMSVWHTWNTMTAATTADLIWYVATYQAPLRDLQIHGLAVFMILGVSIRMLPGLFELPKLSEHRAWWALDLLATAVAGEIALFLAYRWTGQRAFAMALPAAWLMLAAGAGLVVGPWRLWRPLPVHDRSGKFVRAAYGWLFVSLGMLVLMPAYLIVSRVGFSHAYLGATRHAITVGFISLMIMAMAAKAVPLLTGADTRKLSCLWGPFVLVNLGCLLRVSLQIGSDWNGMAYPLLGLSGTLEVLGLAWWAAELVPMLLTRVPALCPAGEPVQISAGTAMPARPSRVEGRHLVGQVLDWYSQTEPVFVRLGFSGIKQPLLRQTVARRISLGQAAALQGVAVATLVDALNASIQGRRTASDSGTARLSAATSEARAT